MSQDVQYRSSTHRSRNLRNTKLLSAQYLASCLEPGNLCHPITARAIPERQMKETLYTRHRNTVEPMMVKNDRKTTLQALHTAAVVKAVQCHERNVVLDGRPPPISNSEKELTRKDRSTKIRILWTPGLLQEQNQEGCKPRRLCRLRHDASSWQASLRFPGSPDYTDTVRPMEQTDGRCPGTQLSRGERPILK